MRYGNAGKNQYENFTYYTELASDLSRVLRVTPSGSKGRGGNGGRGGGICENIFANFKRSIIIHLYMCLPIHVGIPTPFYFFVLFTVSHSHPR